MISRESLAKEFLSVVDKYHPKAGEMLKHCYVKILECYIERLGKRLYYIGVYYPEGMIKQLQTKKELLKEIAENIEEH